MIILSEAAAKTAILTESEHAFFSSYRFARDCRQFLVVFRPTGLQMYILHGSGNVFFQKTNSTAILRYQSSFLGNFSTPVSRINPLWRGKTSPDPCIFTMKSSFSTCAEKRRWKTRLGPPRLRWKPHFWTYLRKLNLEKMLVFSCKNATEELR